MYGYNSDTRLCGIMMLRNLMDPIHDNGIDIDSRTSYHHSTYEAASYVLTPTRSILAGIGCRVVERSD